MFSSPFLQHADMLLYTLFGSKVQAQEILIHRITIRKQDMLSRGRMRIQRVWLNWNVEESFEKEKKKSRPQLRKRLEKISLRSPFQLFPIEKNIQWQRLIFKFRWQTKKVQWINLFEWNECWSSKKSILYNRNI